MVTLSDTRDVIVMICVAAAVGAFAGLGAFALQSNTEARLGRSASILVGGLAAVGVLYFLSPVTKTAIVLPGGSIKTTSQYELLKLVSLSVIVGSAGRVFLTALQTRTSALLSQQASANVVAEAPKALTEVDDKIQEDIKGVGSTLEPLVARLQKLAKATNATKQVKEAAKTLGEAQMEIATVADSAQSHLDAAQSRITAAAGTPEAGDEG